MEKELYVSPTSDIIVFASEDVLTVSNPTDGEFTGGSEIGWD